MAVLVRRFLQATLLCGLFFISVRYIYGALLFYPPWHDSYSFFIAESLGFRDIELFDSVLALMAGVIMTIVEYLLIRSIWRRRRCPWKNSEISNH